MKDQNRRIQAAGITLVTAVLVIGALRSIRLPSHAAYPARGTRARPFHIQVISQQAAFPGKLVYDEKNQQIYRCTAQDAAIAVFTMRDNVTNADVQPTVRFALDHNGQRYAVRVMGRAPFWVLALQAGFPDQPTAVDTTIDIAGVADSPQGKITFFKIAPPQRFIKRPAGSEAAKLDKIASATADESASDVILKWNKPIAKDEFVQSVILDSSFLAGPSIYPAFAGRAFDTYFGNKTDAVKARFDTFRNVESEATLTYKNPEIVERSGGNMIWLPNIQQIGMVLDYTATAGNSPQFKRPNKLGMHPVSQIVVYLRSSKTLPISSDDSVRDATLRLVDIWPSLESMGLQMVHVDVWVLPGSQIHVNSFSQIILAAPGSQAQFPSKIPVLKLRFKVRVPVKVESTTLVLPLRHVHSGRPPAGQIGAAGFGPVTRSVPHMVPRYGRSAARG